MKEIIIVLMQAVGGIGAFGVGIIKLMNLLSANDFDMIFIPREKQFIRNFFNEIILFFINIIFITSTFAMMYNRVTVNAFFRDIAIWIVGISLGTIFLIYLIKKLKVFKSIIMFVENNKVILAQIIWIVQGICTSVIMTFFVTPSNLLELNIISFIVVELVFSMVTLITVNLLRKINFGEENNAKFYFYKWNKKLYLYYARDDGYIVCGEEINYKNANRYEFIFEKKLKDNYRIYRVGTN